MFRQDPTRFARSRRIAQAFQKGHNWASESLIWGLPVTALATATAPRGEKAAMFISSSASALPFPALSSMTAAALAFIPGIGPGTAMALSMAATLFPAGLIESAVNKSVRRFTRFGAEARRLEMGGNFNDSESASGMRMQAIQDMSAALLTSRRFLGQEARLLHR